MILLRFILERIPVFVTRTVYFKKSLVTDNRKGGCAVQCIVPCKLVVNIKKWVDINEYK